MSRIVRNSAQCMECGDEIESTHRHDFKYCSCHNLFVDGGHDYLRRGFSEGDWRETSLVEDDEEEYGGDHWFNYGEPNAALCSCTIGVDHHATSTS